jgi:ribosomal protein S18 acetylase RimI-like enzyme
MLSRKSYHARSHADSLRIIHAVEQDHIEAVRALFEEYAASLSFSLEFQQFSDEVATLPGEYAPESGRLLLALVDNTPAGCVALRRLDDGIGEVKRLYVKPEFRGQRFSGKSIGVSLAIAVVQEARNAGYKKLRLDTVPSMTRAIALYKALGFRQIEPYCYNPFPDAMFFELELSHSGSVS